MSEQVHADDLKPDATEGFKVGEKKTLDEYHELDKDDEAMVKWKKSLLTAGGKDLSDPTDPRTCIIQSLALEVEGRPDITITFHSKEDLEALKNKPFVIKEGAQYRMKVTFKVQHGILSGLKYIQVVKRGPLRQKDQEMIGSYSPNTEKKPFYEKAFQPEEAPSGMLVRGKYNAASSFVDDDNVTHLTFNWTFEIKKEW
ncbi:E set domain-containing protein [Venturia nashicola]|uniref:Rho GDP-dissociation inhibitor n=1 Tax=Venturia nashicola TaxID=86259 RepID=A0A4Z1P8M0_9PEZI|nr:E set domain-containing protein [Venturia nashicola]TLD37751.1 E set domain-containing protein [Venturia nashicola]